MNKPVALLSAVSALALSSAFAGEIQGTVLTADGAVPLRGAEVTVLGAGRTVATGRDGSFRFTGLDAGTYELSVNYGGIRREGYTVTLESAEEVTTTTITVVGDSITVIGQRASLDNALAQQRSADGIVTVLSADAIGQLPDENVAEAARRALGVSIANDQGEGRFISIRGINSQLNATSVNGVRLTSPEAGDRRIGLDVIDADILKNIVINKTLSADMDGDAIGGSIELETVSGLDREDRLVKLKLGGIYPDFTEELSPELAATYLDNFMDGRLGVALSASFQSREFASDNREVDGGWDFENGVPFIADEFEFRNYDIERKRTSIAANFDYMLDDDTRLYLNTLYNEFSDQEFRSRVEYKLEDADLSFDGDRVLYSADCPCSKFEIDRDIKDRLEVQQIFSVVTGFERQKGLWTYDGSFAYTHAEEEEPNRLDTNFDFTFEDSGTVGFNVANPLNPRPFFVNDETRDAYLDASNYEFDAIEATNGVTEDDEFALTFNAQRDMEFGQYPGFLKSGAKVRLRDKSYDLDFKEFGLDGDATLDQFETTVDFPIGIFGPAASAGLMRDFAQADQSIFELEGAASAGESAVSSFEAQEDIYAGYLMGQVDINKLRTTAGVRVEHTEVEATANTFNEDVADDIQDNGSTDFSAAISPFTFSDSYTDVLPSIQARYNVREDFILRASYYASIVRPNFGQFVPAGETNDDGELAAGNPDLERTQANNFDLLMEFYPSPSSVIQGGVFYKTLDNIIVGTESTEAGIFNNVPFEELETFRNIDDGEIFGIELGYQQALEFLPYGLDGVLVGANYTYTDSEATLDDGSTITLPGQSENVYNAFLGYEKGRVNLRLAYSFKDENIDDLDVDGGAGNGRIVLEQEFLDFSAKFEINDNARVYFDAKNLLDTPLEVADRVDSRLLLNQFEEYGLTLQGGILLTF